MPVLGLIFLRYAFSRFKYVEAEIMQNRPTRGGRVLPVSPDDYKTKNALYIPEEARYDYLLNLPGDENLGVALNNAMVLIEEQSEQLIGILPKTYTSFQGDLLQKILRIFNNQTIDQIGGDVIGRIYEYFLGKFAPAVASDDGVFFTPKSLVQMIVNIIEPRRGTLLDPACGSGGMFVQTGDFVNAHGTTANKVMSFYGHEKVDYNGKLCLMNMSVHGLSGHIRTGDEGNTFYTDTFNLAGKCDYVMANPPFNVDKVSSENTQNAGRLPFGLPSVNKEKEVSNANYLWISYFYAYLNERGRAGFVMAASATDSGNKDCAIRENLVKTGHVDVLISVGNNFFYTKSLPCTLWFYDKGKNSDMLDKVLFIDSRNYYTAVDRTLNEWSEWQLKNINAIVWLYRGEKDKYTELLIDYKKGAQTLLDEITKMSSSYSKMLDDNHLTVIQKSNKQLNEKINKASSLDSIILLAKDLEDFANTLNEQIKTYLEEGHAKPNEERKKWLAAQITPDKRQWNAHKKMLNGINQENITTIKYCCDVIKEAIWLTEKFGEGEYQDIFGLCKVASRTEIEEKNWSLTPGAYVGVKPEEEEDPVEFTKRMKEIHEELLELSEQSNTLMKKISLDLKVLI